MSSIRWIQAEVHEAALAAKDAQITALKRERAGLHRNVWSRILISRCSKRLATSEEREALRLLDSADGPMTAELPQWRAAYLKEYPDATEEEMAP